MVQKNNVNLFHSSYKNLDGLITNSPMLFDRKIMLIFTIKGMYARFNSETREPNLATGTTGQSQGGAAYESIGQMKADMQDPKYATDSAFRKMVADKVARSKVI